MLVGRLGAETAMDKLAAYVVFLILTYRIGIEEIRKEKEAEDKEHDEQFH